ncbi:hypothetical protein NDU88_000862 [Pleurodeles waltl]|uniref:Uncharacterized protein n=1 Tax=Pleurodeles waltl TaxID=8319 RepID=A0AAV7V671_PLEWA|nr:hypothetical protein NDU88_000862 [Pleurodeles waltl]
MCARKLENTSSAQARSRQQKVGCSAEAELPLRPPTGFCRHGQKDHFLCNAAEHKASRASEGKSPRLEIQSP